MKLLSVVAELMLLLTPHDPVIFSHVRYRQKETTQTETNEDNGYTMSTDSKWKVGLLGSGQSGLDWMLKPGQARLWLNSICARKAGSLQRVTTQFLTTTSRNE